MSEADLFTARLLKSEVVAIVRRATQFHRVNFRAYTLSVQRCHFLSQNRRFQLLERVKVRLRSQKNYLRISDAYVMQTTKPLSVSRQPSEIEADPKWPC